VVAGNLDDRLLADMKAAMKAGPEGKTALSVIRLLRAALKNAAIEKKRELSEEESLEVLARELKQRRETAEEYERLGRHDAAVQLGPEMAVIERYLPEQLSDDEIKKIVSQAIRATGATGPADLGKVMGKVMPQVRGRADGKRVNQAARELLAET